jgi:hypothetical protein
VPSSGVADAIKRPWEPADTQTMSKRALLWWIATAIMVFAYVAASYSGGGACSTFDFTKWDTDSLFAACDLPPRLAVLLIGLVPALVLVYFAEKGGPYPELVGGHAVRYDAAEGIWTCREESCSFVATTRYDARNHRVQTGARPVVPATGPVAPQPATGDAFGFGVPASETPTPTVQQPLVTPPPAEFKICPDCAEQIRAAARKCRFCGYIFDDAVASL